MASGDDVFGPQLRGTFDFTLVFEQTILSIIPSALFIATAIPRFHSLTRRPIEARSGLLLWLKLTCGIALTCIQIASVVLWSLSSEAYRRFSIAASVLSLLAAVVLVPLSYYEHKRSIRPSSLLSGYLFLSVLLDLAQARTLWIRNGLEGVAVVFILALAAKSVLLILEEAPKTALLVEKSKDIAPEATSGLINRTVFWWLNAVFQRGYHTLIDMPDLDALEEKLTSDWLLEIMGKQWAKKDKTRKRALLEATMWSFRYQLGAAIIPRLAFGGFVFAQPFLINRVINFVGDEPSEFDQGIIGGLIGATVLVYCGIAATRAIYKHLTYQLLTMIRGGLISLIFQKTLELDRVSMTDAAPVTLMSTDIDGLTQGFQYIHDIWGFVIEIGIGLYVLQRYVGYPAFLIVVPSFLSLVAIHFVSKGMGPARVAWNQGVQKRVAQTSSMLAQMKGVKMMGLSDYILGSIQGFRIYEVNLSKKFRMMVVWLNAIANSVDLLSPVFVIIAAVYLTHNEDGLGVAEAFTALSVMVLISLPLANLLVLYPMIASGIACFGRIQTFLLLENRKDYRLFLEEYKAAMPHIDDNSSSTDAIELGKMDASSRVATRTASSTTAVVEVETASFKTKDDTEILHNISIKIPSSKLTVLIGRVGCGKSSLLKAILGEMYIASGSLVVRTQSIAYCDQNPWLMNKSIKDNIVTVLDFNQEWYSQVTQACGLEQDFAALDAGDSTLVGSGGAALSGGQKQRVALARAVYARQELLLLDDIFSGLDNTTSNVVFNRLLGPTGLLRQDGTTVVLATHAVKFLHHADFITMLDSGNTTYNQVRFDSVDPSTWGVLDEDSSSDEEILAIEDDGVQDQLKKKQPIQTTPAKDTLDMSRATGDMSLYVFYIKSMGVLLCLGFLGLAAIFIFGGKVPQIWLRIWTERGTNTDTNFYVGIYATIAVLVSLACTFTVWYFLLLIIPKSAQNLHLLLLEAVVAAPLYFFTTTDLGMTLNRFSQDMTLVDQILPMSLFATVFDTYNVIAEVALIASGATYVAAVIPLCFAALYFLQKYYLRTSRQIRHLDLEAKSPLYTLFTETLSGLITVRAFGWKDRFLELNSQLLDESQKPYYLLYCIQRWLNVALDLFVAGVALVLVSFALNFRGTTGKGAIGLAMVNIINFNTSLSQLINAWTLLETSLGAIARLKTFMADTPQESQEAERQSPPPGWPTSGGIEFQNVTARYSPTTESVLHNISLSIKPGQKIGFCGRTGSGKSSMILTLLRMLELQEGSLRIDGIDLSVLPRQTIRSLLTTLPQDPVKLAGTVRENLDPENKLPHDNKEIESVLKKTNIWDILEARGGLDAELDSVGFSVGQQQLFCLARAILHRSRVLLLDEATSSVDRQSDEEVRKVINEEFADCTVIEVAHRLDNLVDFDMIVVMEQGRIVETGHPKELLEGPSKFRNLWDSQRG